MVLVVGFVRQKRDKLLPRPMVDIPWLGQGSSAQVSELNCSPVSPLGLQKCPLTSYFGNLGRRPEFGNLHLARPLCALLLGAATP